MLISYKKLLTVLVGEGYNCVQKGSVHMKRLDKKEILEEELKELQGKVGLLPNGYISIKHINGGTYYYLQRREGRRVLSFNVPSQKIRTIRRKIYLRKFYEGQIRMVKAELKTLTKE